MQLLILIGLKEYLFFNYFHIDLRVNPVDYLENIP